jgi:hypothetical protein
LGTGYTPDGGWAAGLAGVTVPDIDRATATDAEKPAWVKARSAAEPWEVAFSSAIQDMQLMGIPLKADLVLLGMADAMIGGERSVRGFVAGLTLGAVEPAALSDRTQAGR